MRTFSILLLLVGCASSLEKYELDPEEMERRKAGMFQTCDFMVGPPRNSETYLTCMEYVKAELM